MSLRSQPVVNLSERVPPGPLRGLIDSLQGSLGKLTSLSNIELMKDLAGYQITNAAASPGTDIPEARTNLNLGDAGVDNVRLVVNGKNSAAGSVTVECYRVSANVTLCSCTVTDGTRAVFEGSWTQHQATGQFEEIGLRVVGDGAFDPTLYRVDLQMRTVQRRV